MGLAATLAPISVETPDGVTSTLGSQLGGQNTVLVFIRHFGCIFCREQVTRYREALPAMAACGYQLVVVGQGTAAHARAFRDEHGLTFPLVVDTRLEAFKAAGLKRSVLHSLLDPRVWWRALGTIKRGVKPARLLGDPWQNGGTFVLDAAGRERFRHISRYAGDHPGMGDVLSALG
jgi:hypothetical protein